MRLAKKVMRKVCLPLIRLKWRLNNRHNGTSMARYFDKGKTRVGRYTYGKLDISYFGEDGERIEIGSFCSIASGVRFICGGNHRMDSFSTYPFEKRCFGRNEAICKGPITVKDDVWIGTNAIILSGITLGQGCVVAAGAVVEKDVPPYAIVGGVPARIIRYRFSEEQIENLLEVDFDAIDADYIATHEETLLSSFDPVVFRALPKKTAQ